jgi:exodeoxyribonuclease-3
MKILSYNVNGLRSFTKKNVDLFQKYDPDIIALQETRCPRDMVFPDLDKVYPYHHIHESVYKKGYSGVAIYSKVKPISVMVDFHLNEEGRVIVYEYQSFFLMNVYVPNSKPDLSRLEYRANTWEPAIVAYFNKLQNDYKKPVVMCADFNVAPSDIDIYSTKGKEQQHGFTVHERKAFRDLLQNTESVDVFRHKYPESREYTWFSNFHNCREKNYGWRIDHFVVSKSLLLKVGDIKIIQEYKSSDHNPVLLALH